MFSQKLILKIHPGEEFELTLTANYNSEFSFKLTFTGIVMSYCSILNHLRLSNKTTYFANSNLGMSAVILFIKSK